jgi:SAM-dependent methyltransferase
VNSTKLSAVAEQHLEKVREHFDRRPKLTNAAKSYRRILAHYYNLIIPSFASVLEVGCGSGELLQSIRADKKVGIDVCGEQIALAREQIPTGEFYVEAGETVDLPGKSFDYIVISETTNQAADVQQMFQNLRSVAHADTRLVINCYSSLWRPLVWLATRLGLRSKQPESSWLAPDDVVALLHLSDWELIRTERRIICPIALFGLENLLNRLVAPLVAPLCFCFFSIARPRGKPYSARRTVSVVVPARNESGNIEAAVKRTPEMGEWTELIFTEGNSKDGTWEEIQRVKTAYPNRRIKMLQQSGKGKGNAVREGFAVAEGEILMILDADLTMPPEELPKFYEAIAGNRCEFANGSRLVYPMDKQAMRFLNLCANKTFSILFTWLLGQPVKDTLCGTKVLTKESYQRIVANRSYFGDFDPFGDFDLLFGASKLNLKILDVPIRYKERVYGQTNIQRWKHGWMLLQMVGFAALKLKFV